MEKIILPLKSHPQYNLLKRQAKRAGKSLIAVKWITEKRVIEFTDKKQELITIDFE